MSAEHVHEEHTHHGNYVQIWAILCALLVVSVIGPMFGIQWLTLLTAFGIAVVKAYLVVKNFMHINVAARYVTYLVATALLFMLLFFAAVAPDVMNAVGSNWEKPTWVSGEAGHSGAPAGAHAEHH